MSGTPYSPGIAPRLPPQDRVEEGAPAPHEAPPLDTLEVGAEGAGATDLKDHVI